MYVIPLQSHFNLSVKNFCSALTTIHNWLKKPWFTYFSTVLMHQHHVTTLRCDWLNALFVSFVIGYWQWLLETYFGLRQSIENLSEHVILYLLIITSTSDNMALQLAGVVSTWQLAATCSSTWEWFCWWTWQRADLWRKQLKSLTPSIQFTGKLAMYTYTQCQNDIQLC